MACTLARHVIFEAESVKGSRFVVDLAPVSDTEQARAVLAHVRDRHRDASHHCSAWRLASPLVERSNDDGEPAGSAGRPILAQLVGNDLVNIVAVVTRWFGGTKLGVGGLVRAYGGSVRQALNSTDLIPWLTTVEVTVTHSHATIDAVERALHACGAVVVETMWSDEVRRVVHVPTAHVDEMKLTISDATAGAAVITRDDDV